MVRFFLLVFKNFFNILDTNPANYFPRHAEVIGKFEIEVVKLINIFLCYFPFLLRIFPSKYAIKISSHISSERFFTFSYLIYLEFGFEYDVRSVCSVIFFTKSEFPHTFSS